MNNVLIIGGHGLGDCLMSLQCASVVRQHGLTPKLLISTRPEIYDVLSHLFGQMFPLMESIDESYAYDNLLLKDQSTMDFLVNNYIGGGSPEVYYVIPDLLFCNKYAFDFERYHTSPQMLRDIRLIPFREKQTKTIYLGLLSTTAGYVYKDPAGLASMLASELPDYLIYMPVINNWADKAINKNLFMPTIFPNNLVVDENPSFINSIDILRESCYFVGSDNGPSHLAYHMAVPRLLLDPQFNKLPWLARWREDYLESVPISVDIEHIVSLVKANLTIPQTTLVPRMTVLGYGLSDWNKLLWFKPS